jgi:hypothetical protein
MSFMIPNADALVTYLRAFTGSTNDEEIKQCIFLAEMEMRNIELPILRSNPEVDVAIADAYGKFPIPTDMNKPILFYQKGTTPDAQTSPYPNQGTGPWIVYDRIGDRDIITMALVQQFYLTPVNIPAVVRGKFSEVGDHYQIVPRVAQGTVMHLYYYKAWPLLFTPYNNIGWNSTSWSQDGGSPIENSWGFGTGTQGIVQNNGVLATFPEGYVYGSLTAYYTKRHITEDAEYYRSKFENSWKRVEDQNDYGKWSGGTTRMTSIFQPRRGIGINVK